MYGLAGILYFKKISVMGCDFIDTIIEITINRYVQDIELAET